VLPPSVFGGSRDPRATAFVEHTGRCENGVSNDVISGRESISYYRVNGSSVGKWRRNCFHSILASSIDCEKGYGWNNWKQ